uniref:Capsid protein n=1 Tax=Cygnus columbianus parvo-like hybrid virus TaxID=2794509 RepID=A0A8A4XE06_9VIRU|nr:MAG: capsid protein [Cygnus columbianus parvo-like hybrid virus]
MLFPDQGNIPLGIRQKIARAYRRLRREGVPAPDLKTQIKAIAIGAGGISYGVGKGLEKVYQYVESLRETTHDTKATPDRPSLSNSLRGTQRAAGKRRGEFITPQRQTKQLRGSSSRRRELDFGTPDHPRTTRPASLPTSSGTGNGGSKMADVAMSENSGGGNPALQGTKETPIDDPYTIYRGPPEYTYASLPWNTEFFIEGQTAYSQDVTFRMTSPYQINSIDGLGGIDLNSGAGAVTIGAIGYNQADYGTANWFVYYASMYKYYHVIGAKWTMTVENLGNRDIWLYDMYISDDAPNSRASNLDMQLWNNVRYRQLNRAYNQLSDEASNAGSRVDMDVAGASGINVESRGTDLTGATNAGVPFTNAGSSYTQISGSYRPGDYKREITQDEDVKNWTAVNANPSLTERLFLRFATTVNSRATSNTATNLDSFMNLRVRFSIQYLTEFRELEERLKWPVNRNPIQVRYQLEDGTYTGAPQAAVLTNINQDADT